MSEELADLSKYSWFNQPTEVEMFDGGIEFTTIPKTDFWQRTYPGFRKNDGHALLGDIPDGWRLGMEAEFFYETLFDQAGLFLYIDEDNWAKASIEFEDGEFGQLGSVVTRDGWSDWAVSPISADVVRMSYRLSRRGADFLLECSEEGDEYQMLRIFHCGGDVTKAKAGLYACSPGEAGFKARFMRIVMEKSEWK